MNEFMNYPKNFGRIVRVRKPHYTSSYIQFAAVCILGVIVIAGLLFAFWTVATYDYCPFWHSHGFDMPAKCL